MESKIIENKKYRNNRPVRNRRKKRYGRYEMMKHSFDKLPEEQKKELYDLKEELQKIIDLQFPQEVGGRNKDE